LILRVFSYYRIALLDTPLSKEGERLKLERNGRWLEYIVFKDHTSKMAQALGVPLDVLIDLLYPPSVVF
jgi:hypothetical protein